MTKKPTKGGPKSASGQPRKPGSAQKTTGKPAKSTRSGKGGKAAKPATSDAQDEINPNAHSEGAGELLAPEPAAPAKSAKAKA